jgi:hypothetical protein
MRGSGALRVAEGRGTEGIELIYANRKVLMWLSALLGGARLGAFRQCAEHDGAMAG